MNDHRDLLRETFESHEKLAPDAQAVYARVNEIAKGHRWRRRGLQAAGGVALGAGIIAGFVTVPGLLQGPQTDSFTISPAAPASPEASRVPATSDVPVPASNDDLQRGWDAYFNAGYGYNDALSLAELWNSDEQVGTVKAWAGLRILDGERLPIDPTGAEEDAETGAEEPPDPEAEKAFRKYFNSGYTWDEAEQLAEIWNLDDPSEAKVAAGKKLLAGEQLPVRPKPENVEAAKNGEAIDKFFEAGYEYDDAVELARIWKLEDAGAAKVEGGRRLLAGETLPIKP